MARAANTNANSSAKPGTKPKPKRRVMFALEDESCATKSCKPPLHCLTKAKTCAKRGSAVAKADLRDILKREAPKAKSKPRPAKKQQEQAAEQEQPKWDPSMTQGRAGFNAYATEKMREAGITAAPGDLTCEFAPGQFAPSPPQRVIQFLVHPDRPVDRFGIVHRTGLGKSFSLILGLNNFYHDKRAKAVIFPNEEVKTNFYEELMKFPSQYRDYIIARTKGKITSLSGKKGEDESKCGRGKKDKAGAADLDTVIGLLALTGIMSKAGTPLEPEYLEHVPAGSTTITYPAAPLRAMRYTIAGGSQVLRGGPRKTYDEAEGPKWTKPENPLFRFGNSWNGKNPYSNMIVFMDEFHNLLHPDADVLKVAGNKERLAALRQALYHADNAVIVGATATAIVRGKEDVAEYLSLVKGKKYAMAPTNEGFLSYFQELPAPPFATVTTGTPPYEFPKIRHVELTEDHVQLKAYLEKQKKLVKEVPDLDKRMAKLHPYSSTGIAANQGFDGVTSRGYKRLLEDRESSAVKLWQVVKDVMDGPDEKTLILVHSESGFKQLRALWQIEAKKREGEKCPGACWLAFGEAKTCVLKEQINKLRNKFNSAENKRGDLIRVVVADAKFYEAGISFFGVRRLILVDVPKSWASYMQRIGRALRFCGHANLPVGEQRIALQMYVMRSNLLEASTDQYYLEKLRVKNAEMIEAQNALRDVAVDRELMRVYDPKKSKVEQLLDNAIERNRLHNLMPMDVDSRAARAFEMRDMRAALEAMELDDSDE